MIDLVYLGLMFSAIIVWAICELIKFISDLLKN